MVVQNNLCCSDEFNEARGGAINFNRITVDIFGNTITGSQFSSNSPQGAIQSENGLLSSMATLYLQITQERMEGQYVCLTMFHFTSTILVGQNVATGFGGAIYSYSDGAQNNKKLLAKFFKLCNKLHY